MTQYTCTLETTAGVLTQRLMVVDLDTRDGLSLALDGLPSVVAVMYSDPPWNPGNASYWRTHAKMAACPSYASLLDAFVRLYAECQNRGAEDVFVEQAINPKHHGMLLEAIGRSDEWILPQQTIYEVLYSSKRLPNALLHFGHEPLITDPSGMADEAMTIRAIAGCRPDPCGWIVDPCMGKGTTSRIAHYFGMNCFGTELNPNRLAVTVKWLVKHGYKVVET